MSSVAARPSAPAPNGRAPQGAGESGGARAGEFIEALTLTDATPLVAAAMIGSGIVIVSADIARFLYGWTLFVVIQTGAIAAVAVAVGRFVGVLVPGITPDRVAWFPQADPCVAWLGCRDAATQAIQLGRALRRLVGRLTAWLLTAVDLLADKTRTQ